jgi:hypothetical protein
MDEARGRARMSRPEARYRLLRGSESAIKCGNVAAIGDMAAPDLAALAVALDQDYIA